MDPTDHSMQSWIYWATRRSVAIEYVDEVVALQKYKERKTIIFFRGKEK